MSALLMKFAGLVEVYILCQKCPLANILHLAQVAGIMLMKAE